MPTGTTLNLTKEFLVEERTKGKSAHQIAREIGCDKTTVCDYLRKFGLSTKSKPGNKQEDLLNHPPFDKLKVIKRMNRSWKCLCECGNTINVRADSLKSGHTRSCGCSKKVRNSRNKFVGEISGARWSSIKSCANERGFIFEITQEQVWELFLKQNRKCALSGVDIWHPKTDLELKERKFNASLDRKDSKKGYTLDNVQWVHKYVNLIKMDFDEDYFLDLCKKITEYQLLKKVSDIPLVY